jgi:hypothetical protein
MTAASRVEVLVQPQVRLERLPVSRWHWRLVVLVGLGTPCPHPEALSPRTDHV